MLLPSSTSPSPETSSCTIPPSAQTQPYPKLHLQPSPTRHLAQALAR